MPGFARRPLALLVCCLFAGGQAGHAAVGLQHSLLPEEAPPLLLAAASDEPLSLRTEKRFNVLNKRKAATAPVVGIEVPVALKQDDEYPLFVIADQIEGYADEMTEAEGHVELRKAGSLIFADRIRYKPLDDEVEASGNVRIVQEGAEVETPQLRMRLSEQVGAAEQVKYRLTREVRSRLYNPQQTVVTVAAGNSSTSGAPMMLNVANSYGLPTQAPKVRTSEISGEAEVMAFEGENQMRLTANTFSTCKPGDPDWYMQAAETHLDYDNNEGSAKHASLWFGGVPIAYTPMMSFPLSNQRRSGILHPHFSTSSRAGLDLTVPYYFNLAPNYDLTLFPRYMSKRGLQLGAEVRYLDANYQGVSRVEYLPNDEVLDRRRYGYRIEHRHDLGRGVGATLNWSGVSDDFYWQDLSSRLLQTSQVQLPQQVMLTYAPSPWLQSNLQFLRYQTLQIDPANPVTRPYALEPQLSVSGYKPNLMMGTDFSVIGQFSRFTHIDPARDQGNRLVFYPQLSLPFIRSALQITPKVGLHLSQYALDRPGAGQADTLSRVVPTFSVDSTVIFEREGDWFGKGYIQTLEPRLYYVNIPYRDQSQIPLFDTGLADFNFAQMFAENRYSGFDRINDANQLTAAVTTRLIDGDTGVERLKAMLGQRYYFSPQRVAIAGESVRSGDFSNVVAAVNGLVAPKTYLDLAWEYNYRDNVSERFAAGVRFQPDYGKVLSASYRYTRDPLTGKSTVDQVDLAGQWPLSSQWFAVGRYNHSLRDNSLLEAIAGVEYNAGCWAVRLVGQRLAAISGSPNDSFFLQLELNDFGAIGSNPIGLLRRSIPGYGKINELANSSHLITSP